MMKDNRTESNVVQLFTAKQPRNIKSQSSIATPFIAKSRPSDSPLTIEITGQLAKDIRLDAMAVGKDPENYAVESLAAWYGLEKGFLA